MAKRDLDQIVEDLETGRDFIKRAANRADRVGDKSGAAQIRKHEEEVKKTQENFTQKGR